MFLSKEEYEADGSFWTNDQSEDNSYFSQRNTKPYNNDIQDQLSQVKDKRSKSTIRQQEQQNQMRFPVIQE